MKTNKLYYLAVIVISLIVSLSISFLVYVFWFQSYGFSLKRGLFAGFGVACIAIISFFVSELIWKKFFRGNFQQWFRMLIFWMLVAVFLAPYFLPIPHYPISSLFYSPSTINVKVKFLGDYTEKIQLRGVWLRFNDENISYKEFQFSDEWVKNSDSFFLDPILVGELKWNGKIGERSSLTIFPMDAKAFIRVDWDGREYSAVVSDTPIVFNKKNSTPNWYYIILVLTRLISVGFFLFILFNFLHFIWGLKNRKIITSLFLVVLSFYTVFEQFQNPEIKGRIDIQEGRHHAVIVGEAKNPWQYRIFSEWLIEGMVLLANFFGLRQPYFAVFVLLRVFQNITIYYLVYLYYRRLNYDYFSTLVGVMFVTGSLLNSFHQSDLSFNTYFDVIFYLCAGLLILKHSFSWIPLLMLFASLNRETSGLIPFLTLSIIYKQKGFPLGMFYVILSLIIWGGVFVLLRAFFPAAELFIPYGYYPGIQLLTYNLSDSTFQLLFRFFGFVPLFGIAVYSNWPLILKRFFLVLIPVWFIIHFVSSVISETRLFLVPQLLIFIPLSLLFVQTLWKKIINVKTLENGDFVTNVTI